MGYLPESTVVQDGGGDCFEYVYYVRSDAAERGLGYRLETSLNLVAGTWTTNGIFPYGTGYLDSEFLSVTNRLATLPMDDQFMRLRIQL